MMQLSIFDLIEPQTFDEYRGKCKYCEFGNNAETCPFSVLNPDNRRRGKNPYDCKDGSLWTPHSWVVPRLCGGCKHCNQFEYQVKPEHISPDGKYRTIQADDPLEEPNIYCTHPDGSLNRCKPYEDKWQDGFGIGHWYRQHEWDTCDRWEQDMEVKRCVERMNK